MKALRAATETDPRRMTHHHTRSLACRDPRQADLRGRQGRRARATTTTGSSRPRSRCATGWSTAGSRPPAQIYATRPASGSTISSLEFLIGRLLSDYAVQSAARSTTCRAALAGLGVDLERIARARARRGAGQRRPRPARRLLHGQHGDARHRRLRLRHPLRARPVPAGASTTAGRSSSRRTGWRSAIPGSSSGPRSTYPIGFGGTVARQRRRDGRARQVWQAGRAGAARSPTTRRSSAGAGRASTRCGCGRRARRTRSTSTQFNRGDYMRRGRRAGPVREHLARALPERRHRRPARSCG